ncbi:MAG: hypothetical protein A3A33_01990 [Candidatus Yanofskybacteria bacterium RIFCSPLOWO2_01_FULL_49_25]|uniref:Uncharacterized protein n=1 Tax=Candidatus Yanofskybacteria bacterium RIFCSPLOWO2_01_FULL_49_25 TaxID=1802701 RepID=A0A1F8GTE1_9BACT|nr:MAG: hypothetical protein A3A33_01990 [Candidatus Yanofskybacteria bacterium RIFCSPLOWO2_01_FULL_49_25]
MKIIIKPNSHQDGNEWIPEGMVSFPNGADLTERRESCQEAKCDTKEEADKYFLQACRRKFKIRN